MFTKITAVNLFSWQDLSYEVKAGVSQITGFNHDDNTSEGSGKSSIPNILCWVLYGRIPKDARIDEVIREGTEGSAGGQVELSSGHVLVRKRRPNLLKIVTPAGSDVLGKDAKETQLLINKLIGLDFEAFCQSVYFSQNYPNKFLSSNETSKAQILSEIQDLTVFDRARKRAQDLLKVKESELISSSNTLKLLENSRSNNENNIKIFERLVADFKTSKESKLVDLQARMDALDADSAPIRAFLKDEGHTTTVLILSDRTRYDEMLTVLKDRLSVQSYIAKGAQASEDSIKRQIFKLKTQVEHAERALVESAKHKECSTCNRPFADHELTLWDKEQVSLKNQIQELKVLQNEEWAKLTENNAGSDKKKIEVEMRSEIESIERLIRKDSKTLLEFDELNKTLENLVNQHKRLDASRLELLKEDPAREIQQLEELNAKGVSFKAEHAVLSSVFRALKAEMSTLEILKDGFKEIKSHVFQSLLEELSIKSTAYAASLFEVPVHIRFHNEDSEGSISKIFTEVELAGTIRGIGLLSGGQYKRIELSVDLALSSIIASRSQNPINFRILDEPLKDLSDTSVIKVLELLSGLAGSTILIEHNSLAKNIIHSTFDIEYRDGISSNGDKDLEM